jgi:LuxR family transcriptional regulator, maltose regulon positive regulatory protein
VEAPMGYGKTTAVREHLRNANANFLMQKVYDSTINGFWNGFCSLFNELDFETALMVLLNLDSPMTAYLCIKP